MNRPRRRGIASLELVLVFPMLLAIVCGLFLIARADTTKVAAATKARQKTWQDRAQAPAGQPLRPWSDPKDSKIGSVQTVQPGNMGPLFPGRNLKAQSGNTLIANPWASDAINFPSLDQNLRPHTTVFALISGEAPTWVFQVMRAFDPGSIKGVTGLFADIGNTAVLAAGFYLEVTAGAPIRVQLAILQGMWDALGWLAKLTGKGDDIEDAINKIVNALNCFDNLYQAAQGKPGADPFNK
jgi:hypothetical protein